MLLCSSEKDNQVLNMETKAKCVCSLNGKKSPTALQESQIRGNEFFPPSQPGGIAIGIQKNKIVFKCADDTTSRRLK
jgi:hypothetical protein